MRACQHRHTPRGDIEAQATLTCLLVTADQELKDAVHGPHVEDEPQLRDAHGDQAEQQDGAEHAVHERGGCCGEKTRGSRPGNGAHPGPGEGKKAPRAGRAVRFAVLTLISRFPTLSGVCLSDRTGGASAPLRQNRNSARGHPERLSQRFPTEGALGSPPHPAPEGESRASGTCGVGLALHLQVDSGQAQLVALLQRGLFLGAPHGAAHAQAAPHRGHLLVELLPCDLVVEAQPAELDLHPRGHRKGGGSAAAAATRRPWRAGGREGGAESAPTYE